jgi:hypothetical protein
MRNQVYLELDAIVLFEDMVVIDDKGDVLHEFPHIYCEYAYKGSPFKKIWPHIISVDGHNSVDIENEGYKQAEFFPKTFPEITVGKVYIDKLIELDTDTTRMLKKGHVKVLYSVDDRYEFLEARDKIQVRGTETPAEYGKRAEPMCGIEIMHKSLIMAQDYLQKNPHMHEDIVRQIGRPIQDTEQLTILEIHFVDYWAFQQT